MQQPDPGRAGADSCEREPSRWYKCHDFVAMRAWTQSVFDVCLHNCISYNQSSITIYLLGMCYRRCLRSTGRSELSIAVLGLVEIRVSAVPT